MIQSRRECLRNIPYGKHAHAGLWLERYLPQQKFRDERLGVNEQPPVTLHVADVAQISEPAAYKLFFERWEASLAQQGAVCREAKASGRLVVGLGAESVLENSIALHRTYGVPYLPGSALKGLAAAYARRRLDETLWKMGKPAYLTLFGDTTSAGYVTFFDALYVPGSGHQKQALYPDVITVHHPDYYRGDARPPADWDDPNPNAFLSATGTYLLALRSDYGEWVDAAFEILTLALREEGIGAKTSSGYGRLEVQAAPIYVEPGLVEAEALRDRIEALSIPQVAGYIPQIADAWRELPDGAPKRMAGQAILDKVAAAGRAKKSEGKAWYEALRAYIGPTA